MEKDLGKPLSLQTSFQGNAQAFGASLSSTPILIAAALFVIYLILGMLYESLIHPITIISTLPSAGLGALLLLMAVGYDLSVIAIVGIILLIGIVKKNGIMLVDFALHVERNEGLTAEEAIYQACVLRFRPILMTTMAALLGGVPMMLGYGRRLGNPPAARLRHRRRPGSVAAADALHDARRLSSISTGWAVSSAGSATAGKTLDALRRHRIRPSNRDVSRWIREPQWIGCWRSTSRVGPPGE